MGQTAREIVRELESHRDRLGEDLDNLQAKVKETADWHTYYRDRPAWFLGAAFVGGVVAASIFPGRRSTAKSRSVPAPRAEYAPAAPTKQSGGSPLRSEVSHVVDEIKGALIAFGVAKVKDAITTAIPGLAAHLHSGSRSSSNPGNGRA